MSNGKGENYKAIQAELPHRDPGKTQARIVGEIRKESLLTNKWREKKKGPDEVKKHQGGRRGPTALCIKMSGRRASRHHGETARIYDGCAKWEKKGKKTQSRKKGETLGRRGGYVYGYATVPLRRPKDHGGCPRKGGAGGGRLVTNVRSVKQRRGRLVRDILSRP